MPFKTGISKIATPSSRLCLKNSANKARKRSTPKESRNIRKTRASGSVATNNAKTTRAPTTSGNAPFDPVNRRLIPINDSSHFDGPGSFCTRTDTYVRIERTNNICTDDSTPFPLPVPPGLPPAQPTPADRNPCVLWDVEMLQPTAWLQLEHDTYPVLLGTRCR